MGKKLENIKDNVVDFYDDHSQAIYTGFLCATYVATLIGTFVFAKKACKWYGRSVGKEIAAVLKTN